MSASRLLGWCLLFLPCVLSIGCNNDPTVAVRQEIDRSKKWQASEAEKRNRETISRLAKQSRILRNVSTDVEAKAALEQVDTAVIMSAQAQMLLEKMADKQLDNMPSTKKVPEEFLKKMVEERGANAREVLEAAEALSTDLQQIAKKHPTVFHAVVKNAMPSRIQPQKATRIYTTQGDLRGKKAEPTAPPDRPHE